MVSRIIFRIFTSETISDGICDAFRNIFRIFTSDCISDGISNVFRISGCGGKKKLRQGVYPMPYDLDFSYSLVCGYIWSCILLLRIHKTVEWIKLMFHHTKQVSS